MPGTAAAGRLRVFTILRDDHIIADKLCALQGRRLYSLKTGYREQYAKDSPGAILQMWATRWCFEQPDVDVFDFLGPSAPNKLAWSTGSNEVSTLYVFRPTVAGAIAWLRWSAMPRLRQAGKRVLGRRNSTLHRPT